MAGRSQHPVQIMENQTRFDLNAAVENWRSELAAQPNLTSDNRRELETHLRDLISEFRRKGLNEEKSFRQACKKVGQLRQIGKEFQKNKTFPMRKNILTFGACIGFVASFVMVFLSVGISGLLLCVFHWKGKNYPHNYWPIVWAIAVVLAISAGVHSYRATRKMLRKTPKRA